MIYGLAHQSTLDTQTATLSITVTVHILKTRVKERQAGVYKLRCNMPIQACNASCTNPPCSALSKN